MGQWLSRRKRQTERGKKTAKITNGHKTAISSAFRAAQVSPPHPGLPNSSRVAATVAESDKPSAFQPTKRAEVLKGSRTRRWRTLRILANGLS